MCKPLSTPKDLILCLEPPRQPLSNPLAILLPTWLHFTNSIRPLMTFVSSRVTLPVDLINRNWTPPSWECVWSIAIERLHELHADQLINWSIDQLRLLDLLTNWSIDFDSLDQLHQLRLLGSTSTPWSVCWPINQLINSDSLLTKRVDQLPMDQIRLLDLSTKLPIEQLRLLGSTSTPWSADQITNWSTSTPWSTDWFDQSQTNWSTSTPWLYRVSRIELVWLIHPDLIRVELVWLIHPDLIRVELVWLIHPDLIRVELGWLIHPDLIRIELVELIHPIVRLH